MAMLHFERVHSLHNHLILTNSCIVSIGPSKAAANYVPLIMKVVITMATVHS